MSIEIGIYGLLFLASVFLIYINWKILRVSQTILNVSVELLKETVIIRKETINIRKMTRTIQKETILLREIMAGDLDELQQVGQKVQKKKSKTQLYP